MAGRLASREVMRRYASLLGNILNAKVAFAMRGEDRRERALISLELGRAYLAGFDWGLERGYDLLIEMDADITVTTEVIKDGRNLFHGPHYSGPSTLLSIPSTTFYATTGFPLKEAGEIPPDIAYLATAKVSELRNLSKDVNLAAQNALVSMIDYIVAEYGYDRTQAYMIASVAVDMRIGQLVDVPNVGVTAVLPLDIFVGRD